MGRYDIQGSLSEGRGSDISANEFIDVICSEVFEDDFFE